MTHTYNEAGTDGEAANTRGAAFWHGPAKGDAIMAVSKLTRVPARLISQRRVRRMRRACTPGDGPSGGNLRWVNSLNCRNHLLNA